MQAQKRRRLTKAAREHKKCENLKNILSNVVLQHPSPPHDDLKCLSRLEHVSIDFIDVFVILVVSLSSNFESLSHHKNVLLVPMLYHRNISIILCIHIDQVHHDDLLSFPLHISRLRSLPREPSQISISIDQVVQHDLNQSLLHLSNDNFHFEYDV